MECKWGLSQLGSAGTEEPEFRIMRLKNIRFRVCEYCWREKKLYIYIAPVLASSSLGSRK
jgi:hypothetical protein